MQIITTVSKMKSISRDSRTAGLRIGFVPTMGFLHDGHLSLVHIAQENSDVVVVSIFVNPTQFGQNEDLDSYPRNIERDKSLCEDLGVDYLFYPAVDEVYDPDCSVYVDENEVSCGLCGAKRVGHFKGVLTVVAKLFNMVLPDVAVFGQKDAQQAALIKRMVRDLNFPVEILVGPIVREKDGLAMSSRNTYLSDKDRSDAVWLNKALLQAKTMFQNGIVDSLKLEKSMRDILDAEAPDIETEYIEVVDSSTMKPVIKADNNSLIAIAAKVGHTRLIDNRILHEKNN